MKLMKHLKKNNGSALTMVLFMLFMLSVVSIAVIALTSSELSMSVMTSDRSKALQISKAGAENAAQIIDKVVGQAQEDARVKASENINKAIEETKEFYEDNNSIPDDSPFKDVIDFSEKDVIKILNKDGYENIEKAEYKYQFNLILDNKIKELMNNELKLGTANDLSNGKYTYKKIQLKSNGININEINNTAQSGIVTVDSVIDNIGSSAAITEIEVTSMGEYTSPANGSTYKRSVTAVFGLLTESKGDTIDIPVSYNKLTKIRYNEKPSILSGKALIAQKNIISINGHVNVTGDTVCFGTIPKNSGKVNYDVEGYKFGGIIAGVNPSSGTGAAWWNDITNCLTDNSISNYTSNDNLIAKMIISQDDNEINNFCNSDKTGSFNFNGNVVTSAYVHTLYGNSASNHSDIVVNGDTYARSVKIESDSNYSNAQFKNVYTYDDLKIDGNNAIVKIGAWSGDTPDNNDNNKGMLVGLNGEGINAPASSAAIVSGDSKLYINGSVYVGGSTFYNDFRTTAGNAYISGMSIQKSDSRPAEAYIIDTNKETNPYNYEKNIFYLYDKNIENNENNQEKKGDYIEVTDKTDNYKLVAAEYSRGGDTYSMMEKIRQPDRINPSIYDYVPINIMQKAMHTKKIWGDFWSNDIEYASYFNTGDIKIKPETSGKIEGFCWGGVAANDTIYGPYNGFTKGEEDYTRISSDSKNNYAKQMGLFIDEKNTNELNSPSATKNLGYWIDEGIFNGSYFNEPYENKFMFYNAKSVILTNNSVGDGSKTYNFNESQGCGIIYSKGNIYVETGTNFSGILIAEGNIIFIGDSDNPTNITYNEEVEDIIDELIIANPDIGKFFKYTISDVILDKEAVVQSIKKKDVKNIKIISWKEN